MSFSRRRATIYICATADPDTRLRRGSI